MISAHRPALVSFATALMLLLAVLLQLGCSNGQTEPAGTTRLRASVKSTIADSAVENVFELEAGSLKDSSVTFPPGSLAAGSSVSIKKGTAPSSFAIGQSTPASSPLIISATNQSSSLSGAQEAMTLAIPVAAASLALADPYARLVALLQDTEGNLIVWRRAKIAIIKGKAIFKSRKFGIYQLVFLGGQDSGTFAETEEAAPEEKAEEIEIAENDSGDQNDGGSGNDSESGSETGSESGGESTPAEPPPGDPTKYAQLAFIMKNSCAHGSCHGPDHTTNDFTVSQATFALKKDVIADRLFKSKNMRPKLGDTYAGGVPFSQDGISGTQPLSDSDKYQFATYLQEIGVALPADATVPSSGSINPPQSIGP